MEKVDAWLDGEIEKLLDSCQKQPFTEGMEGFAAFKKAVKERILESYRNGQRSVRRSPRENEATSEGK